MKYFDNILYPSDWGINGVPESVIQDSPIPTRVPQEEQQGTTTYHKRITVHESRNHILEIMQKKEYGVVK